MWCFYPAADWEILDVQIKSSASKSEPIDPVNRSVPPAVASGYFR